MIENIFKELTQKVDEYKKKSGKSYVQIAEEIGIPKNSFANLRRDWKHNSGYPRKETIEKLRKIIKI